MNYLYNEVLLHLFLFLSTYLFPRRWKIYLLKESGVLVLRFTGDRFISPSQ